MTYDELNRFTGSLTYCIWRFIFMPWPEGEGVKYIAPTLNTLVMRSLQNVCIQLVNYHYNIALHHKTLTLRSLNFIVLLWTNYGRKFSLIICRFYDIYLRFYEIFVRFGILLNYSHFSLANLITK